MTFELSPAAKLTWPVGSTPPVKSAPSTPAPLTAHWALAAPLRSPARVTVKVKAVMPDWPSALSALVAAIDSEASSLRITPFADAVTRMAPALGSDNVTEKASFDSTVVSPSTSMVMICELSPAAKFTWPDGRTPPAKSAPFTAGPVTAQLALAVLLRSPVRVTVKVKAVVSDWPSALSALVAAIDSEASSLRITPSAEAVPMTAPALGSDRVTVKASSDSTAVSPATSTVMTLELSPAAKLTTPDGSSPPAKSAPSTCSPPTVHWALAALLKSPVRVTVKMKPVLSDWLSALSALVAAIDSDAGAKSSLWMTPVADAVPRLVPGPGSDRMTVKLSSPSSWVSPATWRVIVFEVSPIPSVTVPEGSVPPAKSAPFTAGPLTAQLAVAGRVVSPVRVTVKVKAVVPASPSTASAPAAVIDSAASSSTIVPVALPSRIDAPSDGSDRVTVKLSLPSTIASPVTATRMFCCVTPGAKVRVPLWAT